MISDDSVIRAKSVIIEKNARIGPGFSATVSGTIRIGYATCIKETTINCGNVKIGNNNWIVGVLMEGSSNSIRSDIDIGNEGMILQNTRINCNDRVKIGNDVGIGQYVEIWTHGTYMDVLKGYPFVVGEVKIGDHVWLTAHSTVMPGTTIGDEVVIGNGTLVNGDVPSGCFFAGRPGKVIRENEYPKLLEKDAKIEIIEGVIKDYLELCEYKGFTPEVKRENLDITYISPLGHSTVFHIETRKIDGYIDMYSEDFRDYLRFRGVKFFTDRTFKSIMRKDFERLK